jgi:hypothetical protein
VVASRALAAVNCFAAVRGESLRIAPHLHITAQDVKRPRTAKGHGMEDGARYWETPSRPTLSTTIAADAPTLRSRPSAHVLGGPAEVAGGECRSLVRQRAGVGGRIVRGEIHPVRAHKVLGSAHVERLRLIQRADHH